MDEEEPAWRAELGEALQRIAWDIERGNGIQGGMDYARRDLEDTVLDAIQAAEERGRREALKEAAKKIRKHPGPLYTRDAVADLIDPAKPGPS